MRRFTPIELALGASLLGCIIAVAVPTFVRELHSSRFVEPTDGLARLGASAIAYAEAHDQRFPESAPLTPPAPPRGKKEADPIGTWEAAPTWKALDFRAAPEGVPHAYSFSFESTGNAFAARARGDLDGDGVLSTFEIRGVVANAAAPAGSESAVAHVEPGMYVESELE